MTAPDARAAYWPAGLVFLLAWLILASTTIHHGLSWDEATYRHTVSFYQLGDFYPDWWRINDRHPPLVKYLMLAGMRLCPDRAFPLGLRAGHLLAMAALAALFFQCLRRRLPWDESLLATVVLFSIPRFFYHAQVATTDALMAALLFALAAGFTSPAPCRRRYLTFIPLLALALLTKYSAIIILPPLLLYILRHARQRGRELLYFAAGCLAAWLLFLAGNLGMWAAPGPRFIASLRLLVEYPYESNTALFRGITYGGRDTPAAYLTVMLLLTTPLPLLAALAWRLVRPADHLAWLGIVFLAFILLFFALPSVPIYDAERQAVFIFPFIVYVVAAGLARYARRWRYAVLLVLLAGNLFPLLRDFPQESSYFNLLAGGRPGAAASGYDIALHADGVNREFIGWLNANMPPQAHIRPMPMNPYAFLYWQRSGLLRPDLVFFEDAQPFAYVLLQNRRGYLGNNRLLDHADPLFAVRREGVIIAAVYRDSPP